MLARVLSLIAPPLCVACAADAGAGAPLCAECRAQMFAGRAATVSVPGLAVWSRFAYDGPAGALVRELKFGGRIPIAQAMAAHVAADPPPLAAGSALVPVPLHPARRRRRGFNHALVFAQALAERTGLAVDDCLLRDGDPRPQVGRGRRERTLALAGRVRAREGEGIPVAAVLVDDVVTTGATLAACAAALRAAGSIHVTGLAYARTRGR